MPPPLEELQAPSSSSAKLTAANDLYLFMVVVSRHKREQEAGQKSRRQKAESRKTAWTAQSAPMPHFCLLLSAFCFLQLPLDQRQQQSRSPQPDGAGS